MTVAAKHFDPQLGIDIHMYVFPPLPLPIPLPTPHIGIVMDPFDYIPVIGAKTHVNGVKRASAASMGLDIHIPLGLFHPAFAPKLPTGPHFDDEIFMGSKTVAADGLPFSRLTMPVLSCQAFGMIAPVRPNKPKPKKLSLVLPTTLNVAIPNNVVVGGPPTVSLLAVLMRGGFALLGKLNRTFRLTQRAGAAFRRFRQHAFRNMKPGNLKCNVLRAEPVDIRDGSVSVVHEDFVVPGRLPLTWTREYASGDRYEGACGHGWQSPADVRLEFDAADDVVVLHGLGGVSVFPERPGSPEDGDVVEPIDGARLGLHRGAAGDEWRVRTKDGLIQCFIAAPAGVAAIGPRVLQIARIEDRCGNHWRFERKDGHLVRIVESGSTDADGTPLQGRYIEVDARHGRIEGLRLFDPQSGLHHPLVRYRYDAAGDLVAAIDPLGAERTFEYVQHRMVRHTDRLGLSFSYAYNARWQVVHAWGDHGLYDYRFRYDDVLNDVEITDSLGHVSIVKFDAYRLPLCEIDPLDGVTVFEYDDYGRTTAIVDPMGLRTEFAYDARGNQTRLVQPDGTAMVSEYDADDNLVTVTDPGGHAWRQHSDARGLLREQVDPLGATTRYDYDAHGQLIVHASARGAITRIQYDRHGQLAGVIDPMGHSSRFDHDALGRLLQQHDPLDQVTTYSYDAKGRLLDVRSPGGGQVRCEYDAEDQLIRYVDEAGAQTRLQYVGIGQIAKRIQPDGHTVEYHYDTEEQLVGLTNQRGERYELKRDALGRIVEEVDYWGQARRYEYDAAGRLRATIDPLGQRIGFDTDPLGRIVRKRLPDLRQPGRQVTEGFKYDALGQLVELRNPSRHAVRRFDPAGRLVEEVQDGFAVTCGYDADGNRTLRETGAGHRVACTYDLRGQVIEIGIDDEAPIRIERDALGRATHEQLGEDVQRRFDYDPRNLLTAQRVLRDVAPLFDTAYDYDTAGNLTRRTDSQQGTDEYRYDILGRLLQHADPKSRVERFFNDPAGDRLQTRIHEVKLRKVVGGEDEDQVQWTREGTYEGVHYVFDRAGDLIRKGRPGGPDAGDLDLVWDANHRLAESRRGGQTTTYGYDPLGRRVFKRNPTHTTWFYWDGDALLGEVKQANDDPEAAPLWVGNVADLAGARKRRDRLKALHARTREYVYYPGTFVPLALIDPPVAMGTSSQNIAVDDAQKPHSGPVGSASSRDLPGAAPQATAGRGVPADPGTSGLGLPGGLHLRASAQHVALGDRPASGLVLGGAGAVLGAGRVLDGGRGKETVLGADVAPGAGIPRPGNGGREVEAVAGPAGRRKDVPALPRPRPGATEDAQSNTTNRVFHFHVDPNGCPFRLSGSSGQIVWSGTLTAWGLMADAGGSSIDNPLRFQGQYFDEETGLSYNRYRYYDPHTGQYVGRDPIGLLGGMNPYQYGPNGQQWIDPLGLAKAKIDPATGVHRMPPWMPGMRGWERQHLVPFAVWRDFMPQLTQLGLTMADVNGAHNMMYMPRFASARPAQYPNMGLHRGFHPMHTAYNQRVARELRQLMAGLQGRSSSEARAAFRQFQFSLRQRTRTGRVTCAR